MFGRYIYFFDSQFFNTVDLCLKRCINEIQLNLKDMYGRLTLKLPIYNGDLDLTESIRIF